jgi:hypothetical protein
VDGSGGIGIDIIGSGMHHCRPSACTLCLRHVLSRRTTLAPSAPQVSHPAPPARPSAQPLTTIQDVENNHPGP